MPPLVEFPCGHQNALECPEEILDVGMLALEDVVAFGAADRFRPPGPPWKLGNMLWWVRLLAVVGVAVVVSWLPGGRNRG